MAKEGNRNECTPATQERTNRTSKKVKSIFVPCDVPSMKNSKQWTGRYLVASKAAQRYKKETEGYWEDYRDTFLDMLVGKQAPYKIELQFVRGSRRRFDYVNMAQGPLDHMIDHGWLPDDNSDIVIPVFAPYTYDKENPGVYIKVL